jgi:hypothetical protein
LLKCDYALTTAFRSRLKTLSSATMQARWDLSLRSGLKVFVTWPYATQKETTICSQVTELTTITFLALFSSGKYRQLCGLERQCGAWLLYKSLKSL